MKLYKRPEKETDPAKYPGQIINQPLHFEQPLVKEVRSYLDTVNHTNFREAGLMVWQARQKLKAMGMSHTETYDWIKTWASGAGDGAE